MAKRNAYNGFNLIGATLPAFVKASTLSTLRYSGLGLQFRNLYILSKSVIN